MSVAKGDLDLGKLSDGDEKSDEKQEGDDNADLVKRVKEALSGRVKDVRVSNRLVDSPSCLIADENEMSMNLSRMLKAAGQEVPNTAPILRSIKIIRLYVKWLLSQMMSDSLIGVLLSLIKRCSRTGYVK